MNRLTSILAAGLLLAAVSEVRAQGARAARASATRPAAATQPAPAGAVAAEGLKQGDTLTVNGRKATVTKLDSLPYVDNEYTRRFTFDTYENPKIKELRTANKLDEVVAAGKTQFQKEVLLLQWSHERVTFGDPRGLGGTRNALEILRLSRQEQKFFCVQCASVLVSAAASVGFVCRPAGHSTHTWTEMWSNEHKKWVHFDPTPGAYMEKDGVPLSTYEARKESFTGDGKGLVWVNAKTGAKRAGKIAYAVFNIIPNTNWMDRGPDYGKKISFIDEHSGGREKTAAVPQDPAVDPYFPINQAALTLAAEETYVKVGIRTLTPNFKTFQVRIDGKEWSDAGETVTWTPHAGKNTLEARSLNKWDIDGPVSTVELDVK